MKEQGNEGIDNTSDEIEQFPRDFLKRKTSELSDQPMLKYSYSNTSSASQYCMYEPTTDQFQVKHVRDEQLFIDINQKLQAIKTLVDIYQLEICMYLMHSYQWNEEKLGNSYFNDNWEPFKASSLTYNFLKHEELYKIQSCQVCAQEKQVFSNGFCNHFYCKKCWKLYIKEELMQNKIFFNCMHSCKRSPVLKAFVDLIAPELSQLYRKKICVNYSIQNKDVCYCPNEKCPYFCVKPNMMEMYTVTCLCGQLYCFKCQMQPHHPALCSQVEDWYKMINSQSANESWIKNNTRDCPKCKNKIQKKVGCAHMRCLCQCQFCYECNRLWDESHASSKTECPFKQTLQSKTKVLNRVVELNNHLSEYMKQALKHKRILIQSQNLIQQQIITSKVIQLKTEVINAWMIFKWVKILICLKNKHDIEPLLQTALIKSIEEVMEPIKLLYKNYKNISIKEMHQYGEQVLQKKEILKKNTRIWIDAWEELP